MKRGALLFILVLVLAICQLHASAYGQATYPRLVAFRVAEGLSTQEEYEPFHLFDLVHGVKNLNPDHLRYYNLDAPLIDNWRLGIALKPGLESPNEEKYYLKKLTEQVWPGSWLFYNGTKLSGDLSTTDTVIRVQNPRVFQLPKKSPPAFGPDDIQIYEVDEQGNPIWENSEQVILQSVDFS